MRLTAPAPARAGYDRSVRGAVACVWLLVAGCTFKPGLASNGPDDAAGQRDSGGNGGDGGAGQSCFNRDSAFAFCVPTPSGSATLDTGSSPLDTGATNLENGCAGGVYAMVGSTEACVIAATAITISTQFALA